MKWRKEPGRSPDDKSDRPLNEERRMHATSSQELPPPPPGKKWVEVDHDDGGLTVFALRPE